MVIKFGHLSVWANAAVCLLASKIARNFKVKKVPYLIKEFYRQVLKLLQFVVDIFMNYIWKVQLLKGKSGHD